MIKPVEQDEAAPMAVDVTTQPSLSAGKTKELFATQINVVLNWPR